MSLSIKQKRTLGSVVVLIMALVAVPVLAQLLSNQMSQNITVRGIDGYWDITLETALPTDGWVDTDLTTLIRFEMIKDDLPETSMNMVITSLTNGLAPENITVEVTRYNAAMEEQEVYSPILIAVNGSVVMFSDATVLYNSDDSGYRKFVISWSPLMPTADYNVLIYIDG